MRNSNIKFFLVFSAVLIAPLLYWYIFIRPGFLLSEAMRSRDNLTALELAKDSRLDPAQSYVCSAFLAIRLRDFPAAKQHLENARRKGADETQIFRIEALIEAQSGRLDAVESVITEWLLDPGEYLSDICDAYTNGLAAQGRQEEAERLLAAWQGDCPEDPKPPFYWGRFAEHVLNVGEAEKQYRSALAKNPNFPVVLYALGRLLLKRKEPEKALPLLVLCGEVDSETKPAVDIAAAACHRLLGETAQARALVTSVLELPRKQIDDSYRRLSTRRYGMSAAFEFAELEKEAGNFESAMQNYQIAAKRTPENLDVQYGIAMALRGLGKSEEAKSQLEYVSEARAQIAKSEKWRDKLVTNPRDAEARYNVGIIYLKYHSTEVGLFWLRTALACDPMHAPTHRVLYEYYSSHLNENPRYLELAETHKQRLAEIE